MERLPTFRCPGCDGRFVGAALSAHLADHPAERQALFARFARDHEDARVDHTHCTGQQEILPLMDPEEKERFGATDPACGPDVIACPCGGSFCAHHTFSCDTCGRFACLRHRFSATCPDCVRASGAKPVPVEKFDPFSKQRSTFIRTYRRGEPREVWDAVAEKGS